MENQCSQIMLYRKNLKRKLAPMRYEHSLSVSYTCMNLAMRYGCDLDKAELAGYMQNTGHGWRSTSIRLRTGKSWMPSAATPQAGRR